MKKSDIPAICNGIPVRKTFLSFSKPQISSDEIKEVVRTLKSGWLTTGPVVHQFEDEFKKYIGCKFAIAVSSCTAGLHLALSSLGIKEGDEVITTPLTFAATANVIVHLRAKPIFVDVEKDTGNIDVEKIESVITKKTKAILPVHYTGRPCKILEIKKIARKYNLKVIEDSAHCVEGKYKNKKIGNISDATAFSFYATKNLTTAEGGMITTNNRKLQDEIRIKSLHGLSKDAWLRYSEKGSFHYEVIYPGYKYNMPDIQASLGIHQLKRIEENLKIREKYYKKYNSAFSQIEEIIIPKEEENIKHARHLYTILIKNELLKITRDEFLDALKKENIGCGIHFISLHLHKFYKENFGYKLGDFPNAEFISSRTISLPLNPYLKEKDIDDVISAVIKIVKYFRK